MVHKVTKLFIVFKNSILDIPFSWAISNDRTPHQSQAKCLIHEKSVYNTNFLFFHIINPFFLVFNTMIQPTTIYYSPT